MTTNTFAILDGNVVTNLIVAASTTWDTGVLVPPGTPVNVGFEYHDGTFSLPTPVLTLAQAQAVQVSTLTLAYQSAISQPVTYNNLEYQADLQSVSNLQASIAGCLSTQVTPAGFYWVSANNTQVPFAYSDLTSLALIIFQQGAVAFQHLQSKKTLVTAATTVSAVQAITW